GAGAGCGCEGGGWAGGSAACWRGWRSDRTRCSASGMGSAPPGSRDGGIRLIDNVSPPRIIGSASSFRSSVLGFAPKSSRQQRRILMTERVPLRVVSLSALLLALLLLLGLIVPTKARSQAPAGELTWAVHISLAP